MDITFFEYPGAPQGRAGAGMVYRSCAGSARPSRSASGRSASKSEDVAATRDGDSLRFQDPEGAERFGLSQFHQFRGAWAAAASTSRIAFSVGDGAEHLDGAAAGDRGDHNGFLLAEEDMRLRGPGEFFGTRQSGVFDLRWLASATWTHWNWPAAKPPTSTTTIPSWLPPTTRSCAPQLAQFWANANQAPEA